MMRERKLYNATYRVDVPPDVLDIALEQTIHMLKPSEMIEKTVGELLAHAWLQGWHAGRVYTKAQASEVIEEAQDEKSTDHG